MKPKTFILLSALSLLQLQTHGQSGEFSDAISELKTKNEEALQKLKDTRASIQDQKIPLASELSGLEREVEEKRRALIRLQRLRDNKSVGLPTTATPSTLILFSWIRVPVTESLPHFPTTTPTTRAPL